MGTNGGLAGPAGRPGPGWCGAAAGWAAQGRGQAEEKQHEADLSAVEVSRDVAETIERLGDGAVRDRARQRMRDALRR